MVEGVTKENSPQTQELEIDHFLEKKYILSMDLFIA